MVWNPATGPLSDPWPALHLVEIDSPDMTANITDNFNALRAALWAPWTSYTPVWTQGATISKTVSYAKYMTLGKTVIGSVAMVATSSGTSANTVIVSLPVAPAGGGILPIGSFALIYSSGSARQSGLCIMVGATLEFQPAGQVNVLGQTPTAAILSGDQFSFTFQYEIA